MGRRRQYKAVMMKLTIPEVRESTTTRITASKDVFEFCKDMSELSQEVFAILTLNSRNMVIEKHIINIGTLDSCSVSPREVFTRALLDNAASVICVHNHPSGNADYSAEDVKITTMIKEGGRTLGVRVLDHIIIGRKQFKSLADEGMMT